MRSLSIFLIEHRRIDRHVAHSDPPGVRRVYDKATGNIVTVRDDDAAANAGIVVIHDSRNH